MIKKHERPLVKLENVWKIYTMGEVEVLALKNVSLEIFKGEFVAIIGSSGSGVMGNLPGSRGADPFKLPSVSNK